MFVTQFSKWCCSSFKMLYRRINFIAMQFFLNNNSIHVLWQMYSVINKGFVNKILRPDNLLWTSWTLCSLFFLYNTFKWWHLLLFDGNVVALFLFCFTGNREVPHLIPLLLSWLPFCLPLLSDIFKNNAIVLSDYLWMIMKSITRQYFRVSFVGTRKHMKSILDYVLSLYIGRI